jgi:hypothetical protein
VFLWCGHGAAWGGRHRVTAMRVFISHAQPDHQLVHALTRSLHEAGLDPVVAIYRPMPGSRLDEKVRRLIRESDCVLVLNTSGASKSRWVQQEIGCAKAFRKHIVPLKTRGARIAAMLEGYEYYPLSQSASRSAFHRIADFLREWALEKGLEVRATASSGAEDDIDKYGQVLHLPHAVICPACKRVDHHVFVCLLCGQWVCWGCGGTVPPPSPALSQMARAKVKRKRPPSPRAR